MRTGHTSPICATLSRGPAHATDAVIVRPAWDENTHYWAGQGHDPRKLPPLDESRARPARAAGRQG